MGIHQQNTFNNVSNIGFRQKSPVDLHHFSFRRAFRGPKIGKNGSGITAVFTSVHGGEKFISYPSLIKLKRRREKQLRQENRVIRGQSDDCLDPTLQKLLSAISAGNRIRNDRLSY